MSLKDRTKILFADTLTEMMKYKALKDIRVGELCEACGANRRTFYYHFQDKYDLLAWTVDHAYEPPKGESGSILDRQTMVSVLSAIRANYSFYKTLYSDPDISDLAGYLVKYNCSRYEEVIKDALHIDSLDDEMLFSLRMYVYGGIYMSREWVLGGCKMEPDELADRFLKNLPAWMNSLRPYHDD